MADEAAHIPAGPHSDTDAEPTDSVTENVENRAGKDAGAQRRRSGTTSDDGIDATGRKSASASARKVRSRELVAVGPGEADHGATPPDGDTAPGPSWSGQPHGVVDDRPQWSFPGVAEEPSTPPALAPDENQPVLPFAAAAAPAPPRPTPTFGPVGRSRSTLLVPVLSVLTLGVYALAWHHDVNRELEEFDPKLHSRPRRSTVAVMVPWLAGMLVTLAGAALIITARLGTHLPFNIHVANWQADSLLAGLAAVPYLTLLLPFSAVAVVMTLERLRSVEEHVGATTDRQVRPVGTSLFLAIPVVGGLMLLAIEQRRLNAIWQAVTTSGQLYS
jgi:hypothetical protein